MQSSELGTQTQTVTVTTESAPVETTRSESAQTVEQRQINNLPINGRSYINFTLTNSQTTRDVSPTIGPAPNSGLNISGARGRSNMVSVDGASAVDNSTNGIRSTRLAGRRTGIPDGPEQLQRRIRPGHGRGRKHRHQERLNDFHGDAFGFLRNKRLPGPQSFFRRSQFRGCAGSCETVLYPCTGGSTLGGP